MHSSVVKQLLVQHDRRHILHQVTELSANRKADQPSAWCQIIWLIGWPNLILQSPDLCQTSAVHCFRMLAVPEHQTIASGMGRGWPHRSCFQIACRWAGRGTGSTLAQTIDRV